MKSIKPVFCTIILLLLLAAMVGTAAHAQEITGNLKTLQGKRILTVWGNHFERGFAHGYLLADDIASLLEDYMLGSLYDAEIIIKQSSLLKST